MTSQINVVAVVMERKEKNLRDMFKMQSKTWRRMRGMQEMKMSKITSGFLI